MDNAIEDCWTMAEPGEIPGETIVLLKYYILNTKIKIILILLYEHSRVITDMACSWKRM